MMAFEWSIRLIVKFQLYSRKLIIQAFKISGQVQLALAGLNSGQVSKSQFNWLIACSFQKSKHFKMLVGQTIALKLT